MSSNRVVVGVLMGGISSEHDVSMKSGSIMLQNIDTERYVAFPIIISKENHWIWPCCHNNEVKKYSLEELQKTERTPHKSWFRAIFPCFHQFPQCDIMLNGLHGVGGEDGKIQGFLDLCNQPYTGSGCLGSALAMNKIKSKEIYQKSGIPTAAFTVISHLMKEGDRQELIAAMGLPLVLKDPFGGSSLGVSIAHSSSEVKQGLDEIMKDSSVVLVEKFIKGREVSCGYLDNFQPLPLTEIVPLKDGFFNYEAKYDSSRTEEITPGNFNGKITRQIQSLSKKCHQALSLSIYSRTDFILTKDEIFVLETNNLPGFTMASILPQEAAVAGLGSRDLLTKISDESLLK